jgi:hypothetical protein
MNRRMIVNDMINSTANAIARLHNFTDEDPKDPSRLAYLLKSYYSLLWIFKYDLSQLGENSE